MNKPPKQEQPALEDQTPGELAEDISDRSDMETRKWTIDQNSYDYCLGAGAAEVAGYVPTRYEIVQLVKYWYGQVLEDDWFFFAFGRMAGYELWFRAFAVRRIERAAEAIGKESVDQAIDEVRERFKAKVNDARLWDIFENDTEEQVEAVRAETYREWREQDAAEALKRLEQLQSESPRRLRRARASRLSDEGRRPVMVSPTNSELHAVLQAMGKFEMETDVSKGGALMVDQQFSSSGSFGAHDRRMGAGGSNSRTPSRARSGGVFSGRSPVRSGRFCTPGPRQ